VSSRFWLLFTLAVMIFLASTLAILAALEYAQPALAWTGAAGMAVAALLYLAAAFLPPRRVDWGRIRAEQRLWESGPLGRAWLSIRKRLSSLSKL
jgi:membrane protein YdbS with pleckstrin-like domain